MVQYACSRILMAAQWASHALEALGGLRKTQMCGLYS